MRQKYTFEDWRFGHVVLMESFIAANRTLHNEIISYFDKESIYPILSTLPISTHWHYWEQYLHERIVDWSAFDEKATEQIKSEQTKIYESQSLRFLENFKDDYSIRESNSEDRVKLIELEIKQCESILFGGWREIKFEWHNNFKVISLFSMFDYIREHYLSHVVNGKPVISTFIHSPIFQMNYELDSNIQSNVCYQYYKWLKKKHGLVTEAISNPRIFTSALGFKIFNAFFEKYLRKDQLHADISYLYYKMRGDYSNHTEYIHKVIKHNEFIKFCTDHLSDKLNESQITHLQSILQLKKRPREPQKLKSQFADLVKEITKG